MQDIAHSLAAQVRFNGHSPLQPTIAQHSLAVEYIAAHMVFSQLRLPQPKLCADRIALKRAALMHDAAEYLVGDLVSPVKRLMRPPALCGPAVSLFDEMEDRVQAAIVARFDCGEGAWAEIVHEADGIANAYEMSWGSWYVEAAPPSWVYAEYQHLQQCYASSAATFLCRADELEMRD